jgi:fatty acid kinase fatty acid binding subunit
LNIKQILLYIFLGGIKMEKIALVTDSTSDLPQELIDKYDVKILPLKIIYKDKEYIDRETITPQEVYDSLKYELPHTSLPSIQEMDDLFTQLEKDGYTHVIAVTISSNLSGTFNAIKLVSENHTNLISTIFDSKALTLGAGELILQCGDLINNGKNYNEIINMLPKLRDKISVFYIVDTLEYLIKGGRIGKVSGTIGKILNLKPIISINKEGVYYTYKKARGKKPAIKTLLSVTKEKAELSKLKIWVMHGAAYEEGIELLNTLKTFTNITSLNMGEIGPVAGVHTGPGLLGLVIVEE